MRRKGPLIFSLLLLAQVAFSQSLIGTWVSDQLLLSLVRFSITFRPDMTYQIDTSLGRTIGTYTYTPHRIIFTPVKVGIDGEGIGSTDVYPYRLQGDDTLYLDAQGNEVRLIRTKILSGKET